MRKHRKPKVEVKAKPSVFPPGGVLNPERRWEPSIRCGCGECRFKRRPSGRCPRGDERGAVQLWSSYPRPEQRSV